MTFSRRTAAITTPNAPAPNGNYSHCIKLGSTLHLCGWMGDEPSSGKIVEGGIEAQTVSMPCLPCLFRRWDFTLSLLRWVVDILAKCALEEQNDDEVM